MELGREAKEREIETVRQRGRGKERKDKKGRGEEGREGSRRS